jgi:broad specificity phosphatase PhoE
MLTEKQKAKRYPEAAVARELSEWYWQPPGGESKATGVRSRNEDILGTLHRESNGEAVLAVTHGGSMRVWQFILERHTPTSWEIMDKDKAFKMENCMILHYSRRNPFNGEIARKLTWLRAICPCDETKSWNNGEWIELSFKKFTDDELLAGAELHTRLF